MSPRNPALRTVTTSTPPNTIWSRVSEDEFRRHLVTLEERTNAVPVDVVHTPAHLGDDDSFSERNLPLQVEKRIADDIAYIAAVTEGAQSVAAVCLERQIYQNGTTLLVRVAGMDVVDEQVREMLNEIVEVFQLASSCAIAKNTIDLDLLTDKTLRLFTQQHRQKLLGRLRSKKWTKPKHLSLTHKKPLWKDFENVIHRVQHVYPKRSDKKVRDETGKELSTLQNVYETFESLDDDDQNSHLQALIKSTYRFCRHIKVRDFAAKLEVVGRTVQVAAAVKTLHQLEKIGAYWRIALSFVETAHVYPEIFRDTKLEFLTPYASVPTTIAYESWAKTCHVHAEIQLTVDYALRRSSASANPNEYGLKIIWPRTVGTSKYLCYLCHLFLTYHGDLVGLNTHGRLYDQWTVPDLAEYDEQIRLKFAETIEQVDEHICRQIEQIKEPVWKAEPMTSRQNLLCLPVNTDNGDSNDTASETEKLAMERSYNISTIAEQARRQDPAIP